MSQETSIIINHNGFLVWGPKGPKNKKNNNFTLCMTMPQAAGKKLIIFGEILSFRIICLSFLENLLEFFQSLSFFPLSFFSDVQKKSLIIQLN